MVSCPCEVAGRVQNEARYFLGDSGLLPGILWGKSAVCDHPDMCFSSALAGARE